MNVKSGLAVLPRHQHHYFLTSLHYYDIIPRKHSHMGMLNITWIVIDDQVGINSNWQLNYRTQKM